MNNTVTHTTQRQEGEMSHYLDQAEIDKRFAEANERAYFCQHCKNWQLKASHPTRCPKEPKS